MSKKIRAILRITGHTMLSFGAALVAGFTFYAFFRPLVGHQRYYQLSRNPLMLVLMLIVVALWGVWLYDKWHDRYAFYAWVFPGIWVCHRLVSTGSSELRNEWGDTLFFVEVGAAYSIGAVIAAWVLRKTSHSVDN